MQLLNIESKVAKGDCPSATLDDRSSQNKEQSRERNTNVSLRELFENRPSSMCGHRTEVSSTQV